MMRPRKAFILALALGAAAPAPAASRQADAPVTGDATAGLVSRTPGGEVHLVADPTLADGRLVLRIVVLNRGAAAAPFGPDDVQVAAPDGTPIALTPRETLLAEQGGAKVSTEDTAQGHANPTLPVNGAGQTDVTGFTGTMGATTAGVPQATIDRSQRGGDARAQAAVAALDAVLLKPMTIAPGAADGGQVVTARLRRGKPATVIVTVGFAGEDHRFAVAVPKR